MTRWKITVEYDGTDFRGWQRQADAPSVQQAIEEALRKFSGGQDIRVTGAGRTDAGVHALGQVAHFDLSRPDTPRIVCDGLNALLRPLPVAVLEAVAVADGFDARLQAIRRHYLYRIVNRRPHPAVLQGRVWHVRNDLDLDAMRQGAAHLIGRHDFSSFRASECQAKSPVKTLQSIEIAPENGEIAVRVAAPSFLHHQVRNIVGTLKLVGEGHWPPARVAEALAARHRAAGGPTAPAHGLYFARVEYHRQFSSPESK